MTYHKANRCAALKSTPFGTASGTLYARLGLCTAHNPLLSWRRVVASNHRKAEYGPGKLVYLL